MVKVASMYYEEGLTQAQIANIRGVSRSLISKLLIDAKEAGIVEIIIKSESIYTIRLERALEKRYNLKNAVIIDTSDVSEEEIAKMVGQQASIYLSKIIGNYKKIGMSWGRSLKNLVNSFPYIVNSDSTVIPIIGGMSDNYFDIQSNQLSHELARKMRGNAKYLYAPAIVSNMSLHDDLINNNAIQSIIQDAKNVELALVGISTLDLESNMRKIGYLTEDDIEELRKQGGIGVINSRFYNKYGIEIDNKINSNGIGLTLEEIKNIPDIMTVVHGDRKCDAIRVALEANLINIIVTTNTVAEKLLNM
ncbi:sugar-binding transcriptional regulator [Aerococcaceae bacterium WGS1372]